MSDSKTYLVTGCAGFIASRVTQHLLNDGHAVVGIDNLNDYYDVSLKNHRVRQLESSNFQFSILDLENTSLVNAL
eukprot:COSAG01_NODE_34984_length_539_cov_0.588636_2_plen_74_part_01